MNNTKISSVEAVFIILITLVVQTVLSLPKTLIERIQSSVLVNIIYIAIMALFLVYMLSRLFKNFPGLDILDISEILGGKILKNVIGFIFITYFIVNSSIFLRNFSECLRIIYYPSTDIFYIIVFFIFGICLVNSLRFNASIKATVFIMPAILISIFFLFFANFRNFEPQRVFPILGNGIYNTFITGLR